VCKLDSNCLKNAAGVMDNAHCCAAPNCQRIAHDVFLASPRKMHDLRAFRGMTCFEMLHSDIGKSAWKHKGTERTSAKEKVHSVNYGHPVVQELRLIHGRQPKIQRRRRQENAEATNAACEADTEESQSQSMTAAQV